MIFNFRIGSDEVHNFKREIKIDGSATFYDLKNAICDSVGYDKSQMCSFFLCSDSWEMQREITSEDMDRDDDQEALLMDECVLSDYIDDEGQKLLFVFDYMTERSLKMEVRDITYSQNLSEPLCTLSLGKAPKQTVDIEDFAQVLDIPVITPAAIQPSDLDEEMDLYGADDYDADEIDPDSFSDVTEE